MIFFTRKRLAFTGVLCPGHSLRRLLLIMFTTTPGFLIPAHGGMSSVPPLRIATLTGTITDAASQEPLAGVNILVKGTTRGTNSDAKGQYALDVEPSETLIVSLIGYSTIEIPVGQRTTVDITLEADSTTERGDQMIGTNYFSVSKDKSTMNIAKVNGEDIERQPVTSLMNAVIGRMAGVDVTPVSGVAGIATNVRIRGMNSLRPDATHPLYVIDGVQIESQPIQTYSDGSFAPGFDPLSSINPADIESIEVLKDAAATAIYGSRGANGVIRITTRKAGASQRSGLELSAYTGIGQVSQQMDLLSTKQYMAMRHEAFRNSGLSPNQNDWDLNGTWDTTRYTNFQKELLGNTAKITDIHGGISGGNGLTGVRLNGGYHKEGTIYPGDFGMQRINAGLSFNHTSSDRKFKAIASVYYGWIQNKSFNDPGFVYTALSLPPIAPPLRDKVGNINFAEGKTSALNPLASFLKTDQAHSNQIISNATLSYQILKGLSVKNSLSLQYFVNNQVTQSPIAAYNPLVSSSITGSATFTGNTRTSLMVEPQITYNRQFSGHQLSMVAGVAWQSRNATYQVNEGAGYSVDALLNSLKGAARIENIIDNNTQYRYAAGYARIGYNFRNRYLIDLTGRRDGSSRFASGKKYGNFGAVGAAWIFSNEYVIKDNVSFLSFGKIRGSYGTTGNDQVTDYLYYGTYRVLPYPYQGAISLVPSRPYNPNYTWETTTKTEIAIELGFFQDRIFLEAAWYSNRSSHQLINSRLPGTTGFFGVASNFNAVIENTGTEIVVNTRNLVNGSFHWSTSFNLTIPKNKLAEFPGLETSSYANSYKIGEPLSIQSLYTYKGIDRETGSYVILDKDNNNTITPEDKRFTSPTGRRYYGGLSNTFTYKNFELSLLLQFSKAQVSDFLIHPYPGLMSNQPAHVMNRWRKTGDVTSEPKFSTALNTQIQQNLIVQSDRNTAMVNFIRLKTASFSYSLPTALTARASISDARIFVQGQNLLTFTSFDQSLDPETGNSLPPLRIVNIGFQIKI